MLRLGPLTNTQRRFVRLYLDRALRAYLSGNIRQGDQDMANALTYAAPVGALITQTFN